MKELKGLVLQKITNNIDPQVGIVREVINEYKYYSVDPNQNSKRCRATIEITSNRKIMIDQHTWISTYDLIYLAHAVKAQAHELETNVIGYMKRCSEKVGTNAGK